ncbi:MAG TPA: ABC transporter ATP-binding protein [Spirochaetota bacterium]|nr:ABC transporter ATP-binding protein [Spirochaetota bacterium]HQH97582.1 ABC transporter ATP-binding protein [Spirochaetota bacterium]
MSTAPYSLTGEGLAKKFGRSALFKGICLSAATGESLSITGPNGSGKSTLMKILAGIQKPTAGNVDLVSGSSIEKTQWLSHIGYTGPLVNPYDELTGLENIAFAARPADAGERAGRLLETFGLGPHRDKKVKHYSSGMKQRLKLILAFLNDPPVLMLDEPGMNLDSAGTALLHSYLESVRKEKIIIIATNDPLEEQLCGRTIKLG